MPDFIVDANILISMMISGKSFYKPILSYFNFYTPDYALEEINKYEDVILEKTKLNYEQLQSFSFFVFDKISVIPGIVVSNQAIKKALQLTSKIDIKDTSYIALSIELGYVLLTRDKFIVNGLRRKGFRRIMTFENFLSSI